MDTWRSSHRIWRRLRSPVLLAGTDGDGTYFYAVSDGVVVGGRGAVVVGDSCF